MDKRTITFIEKARQIHGDKYDYSKVEYVNTNTKVCIICQKHGEFWQTPHNHLAKHGCQRCSLEENSSKTRTTKYDFTKKAREVHGGKYDYSKVIYINAHTKVCIICPIHGEFWQTPNSHLNGKGCPKCGNKKNWDKRGRITTEQFIEKARQIHGDKYDYSKVEYVNADTKVCIICPIHGEFWQTPSNHLYGKGCLQCGVLFKAKKQSYNLESFIEKACKIHGDKYDYSKVNYINSSTKICIICPIHGEFWQTPSIHLSGSGCKECGFSKTIKKKRYTTEEFIVKAREVHGDKYDYSKVEYANTNTKVCIICQKHGEFWQTPSNHLRGKGCPKCYLEVKTKLSKIDTNDFIKHAREVHGDKYDYSKVEYVNAKTKVCIICPIHGEFWQTPDNHLHGNGCNKCYKGKSAKELILLDTLNSNFGDEIIIYQAKINWLKGQSFDFYFPKYNFAIELQGEQHFKPIKLFGGNERFQYIRKKDIEKNKKSKTNNCPIFYFSYCKTDIGDFPFKVVFEINELLKLIKNEINLHNK